MKNYITHNISLTVKDEEQKRAEILEYFVKTYELYERLFELLKDDSVFYERPEALRHPIIFYFGHTAAFYINKLFLAGKTKRINPRFESIFAVGVDEMSWDDLGEQRYEWPSAEKTREYRDAVKAAVIDVIKKEPMPQKISWDDGFWAILMGCEHERIHLETSSVLIRQTDIRLVKESPLFAVCEKSKETCKNELLSVGGGVVKLGKAINDEYYGWDNEYGSFNTTLKPFFASKYLVSNGEFLEFVKDGGYERAELWEEEGRSWLLYKKPSHPVFWIPTQNGYKYRSLAKELDMPNDWPVDVNYHEAKAYCNWLGQKIGKKLRLPSEAEWHRLAQYCGITEEMSANINLAHFASASPVDMFSHGDFFDVFGNVWQWCETPIYPFDGFRVHPLYDDFSAPTFDDRHNIIKGGSFISTGNEALFCSRYAFRRHFFQHAGFRYVSSDNEIEDGSFAYEIDESIAKALDASYGGSSEFFDSVSREIASSCKEAKSNNILHIGCGVGALTFFLAGNFGSVTGVDFSARLIRHAVFMKEQGRVRYSLNGQNKEICQQEFGIKDEWAQKIEFWQADAANLKPIFSGYDAIVISDLNKKAMQDENLAKELAARVTPDGSLALFKETLFGEWTKGLDRYFKATETLCGGKAYMFVLRE